MFVQNSSNVTLSAFHIQHRKALLNFVPVSSLRPTISESPSKVRNEDNGEIYIHVTVHRDKFPYNKTN
jgi:hypothetical protein